MKDLPRIRGGWKTILADPPWFYHQGKSDSLEGLASRHYQMLSDDQIRGLPVQSILNEDAQIWLWTTNQHIHLALHCLESWGVDFKTMLTWVKPSPGVGIWLRGQTEHLLIGARGHARKKYSRHFMPGKILSTVFFADRGKHSEKPKKIYSLIEEISEEPRLELFARGRREGWEAWGNQVESEIQTLMRS